MCDTKRKRDSIKSSGTWTGLKPTLTRAKMRLSDVGKSPEWPTAGWKPMRTGVMQPSRCRGKFEHGWQSKAGVAGYLLEALGVSPGQAWLQGSFPTLPTRPTYQHVSQSPCPRPRSSLGSRPSQPYWIVLLFQRRARPSPHRPRW